MADHIEGDACSSPVLEGLSSGSSIGARGSTPIEFERPSDFELWAPCKKESWQKMEENPNAFFYRHVAPGEIKRNGSWTEEEKQHFIRVVEENPVEIKQWGLFSRKIPGRVGYQCNAFYKKLVLSGEIKGDLPEPRASKPMQLTITNIPTDRPDYVYPWTKPMSDTNKDYIYASDTPAKKATLDVIREACEQNGFARVSEAAGLYFSVPVGVGAEA